VTELPPEGPAAGSSPIIEEAAKLAAAVQEWARKNLPEPTGDPHSDCQWCPLCQFASVLRGERPEVNEKLTEAGHAIVGALRALLEPGIPGVHRDSGPGAPPPRVQHIDLGDPTAE
jgi:hypothetical protein